MKKNIALVMLLVVGSMLLQSVAFGSQSPMPESNAQLQTQIGKVVALLHEVSAGNEKAREEAQAELEKLRRTAGNVGYQTVIDQLAYYVMSTAKDEEVLLVRILLDQLNAPPQAVVDALAPYVGHQNPNLNSFVSDWLQSHDRAGMNAEDRALSGANFLAYRDFITTRLVKDEDLPEGFVKYIFQRDPGRALLAVSYGYAAAAKQSNQVPDPLTAQQRGKVTLAENTVRQAVWAKENGFTDYLKEIEPEAINSLVELSEHGTWWVRLYVANIMKTNQNLRQPQVINKLKDDENDLVSKTITSIVSVEQ